ncbi:MAG: calcium/proton exchanger [Halanaerobium sp.]|nr:calcium/proton exchanger [Halanaerobium sp.]
MNYLLLFVPVSITLRLLGIDSVLLFISSSLAIIPLAVYVARSTSEVAKHVGPAVGGFLNVTFGNATEIIISLFAIIDGLLSFVKAAITGSIVSNLLLLLGLAFLFGGIKFNRQKFNDLLAVTNSAMLMLAVSAMLIPAVFHFASPNIKNEVLGSLSLGVAVILFLTYFSSLFFTMGTHKGLIGGHVRKTDWEWSLRKAVFLLAISTTLVAVESNILVKSIEGVEEAFGLSRVFIGVVIIPVISNAAEHLTAILMAREDRMDLSLNIALGSSIQVSLFIVPSLIIISHLLGHPMNVLFSPFQIVSIFTAALVVNVINARGESNWFEGVQLLATYLIIALAFFFL